MEYKELIKYRYIEYKQSKEHFNVVSIIIKNLIILNIKKHGIRKAARDMGFAAAHVCDVVNLKRSMSDNFINLFMEKIYRWINIEPLQQICNWKVMGV